MDFSSLVVKEFVNVLRVYHDQGNRVSVKKRAASAMIVPLSGDYVYTQDGAPHLINKDHFLFVPAGASYSIECGEGYSLVFNFHAEGVPDRLTTFSGISPLEFQEYFNKIAHLKASHAPGGNLSILSMLYEIFYRCQNNQKRPDRAEEFLAPALSIMREDFSNPKITCQMLAETLHISTVYFRRLFQEKYGVAPAKYLKTIRMEHARRLIQERMPIQHVAKEAGYCDIYQFSRAYKQYFGHAPTNDIK